MATDQKAEGSNPSRHATKKPRYHAVSGIFLPILLEISLFVRYVLAARDCSSMRFQRHEIRVVCRYQTGASHLLEQAPGTRRETPQSGGGFFAYCFASTVFSSGSVLDSSEARLKGSIIILSFLTNICKNRAAPRPAESPRLQTGSIDARFFRDICLTNR